MGMQFPLGEERFCEDIMKLKYGAIIFSCLLFTGCASNPYDSVNDGYPMSRVKHEGTAEQLYKVGMANAHEGDDAKAVEYLQGSARSGYPKAQYALGYMYQTGRGVEKNPAIAEQWYERAAENGSAHAQYRAGMRYLLGQGVNVDYKKAYSWFKSAADQGSSHAQTELGYMYLTGLGVEQNYEEAFSWFQQAANNGSENAKYYLAKIYAARGA